MPAVVALIPAIASLTALAVGATAFTVALVGLGASIAVGLLMGSVFKPRTQNGFAAEAQGRTQIVRSNVQPRNIIYGRAMTSGPLVFAASTDGNGKANQFMHLVVALADHECDAIEEVFLGEDPVGGIDSSGFVTGGKFLKASGESRTHSKSIPGGQSQVTYDLDETVYRVVSAAGYTEAMGYVQEFAYTVDWYQGSKTVTVRSIDPATRVIVVTYEALESKALVRVKKHLGAPDQAADGDLVAEVPGWTWDHRLSGVCYVYLRLEYDVDIFPNGLPNIKAVVRGKRLYDPRTGGTYWSHNWALCVYDYLRDERGFGCTDADIDLATVIAAANISDEPVQTDTAVWQERYLCDGIVMSDKSPRDNLAELVTAGAGVAVIAGGVFRVFAGAYDVPTVTLTESDLRGPVKVQPRTSRKDLFNVVKGTYIDPGKYWQPGDFPAVRNATYAANDGEVIERDIELPFTTNTIMAQRIAKIILERSRQSIVVEFPAKLTALQLTAYSTVKLSLAKFGWTDKVFRVMDWRMSDDGGVDLILNEEATTVYDWNLGNATVVDPAPDTNLPNPFVVEPLGQISLASGEEHLIVSSSGVVTSRMLITWPGAQELALAQNGRVEMEYKRADSSVWSSMPTLTAETTSRYLSPVEDGAAYVVRGRFVSAIGVRSSAWTYSPLHVVTGKLAAPSNLTGLSMTVLNGLANLTWDAAIDLDVRNGGQARIRHTTDLVQPSWGSAIDIGGYISGAANSAQLPLLEGVYLAKWIDSTGHESPTAAMVVTTAPSLLALNVVATVQEQPTFAGAKTNVIYDPALNGIKLTGAGLIDDQGMSDAGGLWDTQPAINTLGLIDDVVGSGGWGLIDSLGGIVGTGEYVFAGSLDLGTVEKSRLTATIDAVSFDTGDMIDFRYDLIDTWASIDGDRINDTAVSLYVRTTPDDPAGSPTWSAWQRFSMGDYEARAFQWKVVMESGSATHNVVVTGLSVNVDMPDRRESGRDIVSTAGTNTITFGKPFRALPVLGITIQNMSQGDYYVIGTKTLAGFPITFYNSASVPVSRRFDWDAISY